VIKKFLYNVAMTLVVISWIIVLIKFLGGLGILIVAYMFYAWRRPENVL